MTHPGPLAGLPARLGLPADGGPYILAAAFVLGSVVVGALVEFILTRGFSALAGRTRTRLDDVLASAFRGPIRLFFILVGILLGILVLPILGFAHEAAARLFEIALMLVVVVVAARIVAGMILTYGERSRIAGSMSRFLRRLAITAIYVVGILVILDNQGLSITPLLTTLGLAGLAAALAFQDTLANFFAGIYVQADKPLDVGHRVRFEDLKVEGTVVNVGWRTTKLRTPEGDVLVIPNVKVASGIVVDYDLPEPRTTLRVPVRVKSTADPRKVARILEESARSLDDQGIVGAPKARFAPGFVGGAFELTLTVDTTDFEARERVADEIRHRIVERLRAAEVEMA